MRGRLMLVRCRKLAKVPFRNSDGSLSTAAETGKTVFETANCAQCHGGTTFTDSPTDQLHDIGTMKATSGQRLGGVLPGIDTPTLRGVWNSAPYLHDGSALTLQQAIQAHNNVTLTSAEVDQLVAYLKEIDDSELSAPGGPDPV